METKLITLDSTYGFAIYMTEPGMKKHPTIRNRARIIIDKNNTPILFNNANMAFLYANIDLGLTKGDFKLKLIKYDSKKARTVEIANFEAMQLLSDKSYQVITKDMIYYVKEHKIEVVKSIRYFVFENGDKERTEKVYGRRRNKYLMRLISRAATEYLFTTGILSGVRRVSLDELEISFKNSTAKIHVMTNGLISNINKTRRETLATSQYQRCIPYDNTLDKYVTIFSYVTKETAEADGYGYEGEIDEDIERLYQFIEDYIKETDDDKMDTFKYLPIDFNGTILIKE